MRYWNLFQCIGTESIELWWIIHTEFRRLETSWQKNCKENIWWHGMQSSANTSSNPHFVGDVVSLRIILIHVCHVIKSAQTYFLNKWSWSQTIITQLDPETMISECDLILILRSKILRKATGRSLHLNPVTVTESQVNHFLRQAVVSTSQNFQAKCE